MKQFILTKFLELDASIINAHYLEQYIDFCILNATTKKPKATSLHHILPRAKNLPFKKYSKITDNPWNGVHLSYFHHYYAHFLLAKAIDHISTLTAFCGMHNKDFAIGRISADDLISEQEYTLIYNDRNNKLSNYWSKTVTINDKEITRAKLRAQLNPVSETTRLMLSTRMQGSSNIVHIPGALEKMRETKITRKMDTIGAINAANTMKQKIIDDSGNITTTYEQNGKKLSQYLNAEIIDDSGNITTNGKKEQHKFKNHSLRMEIGMC